MWQAHRTFLEHRHSRNLRGIISAWKAYRVLQRRSRELRAASRLARRQWFENHILTAEAAAQRQDIGAVYRVIRILAPKRRYDTVKIRKADGTLLGPREEFDEILAYFRDAFDGDATAFECTCVVAVAVRERLNAIVGPYVAQRPQFAYIKGKSIDGAIARVLSHCSSIRAKLQHSCLTVHDRREGRTVSRCLGGAMLSLDLSRAFDEVPRPALDASLAHAGVPADLRELIMQLHTQCHYAVTHKGQQGHFPMRKGVRQGCALSPLLFTVYTCHLYDVLASRTSASWAAQAITMFADDTHISWDIDSTADLRFLVKCIQITFQTFEEFGMRLNPDKSKFILKIRGGAARKWIKAHTQRTATGPVLNLGTPHAVGDPVVQVATDREELLGHSHRSMDIEKEEAARALQAREEMRQVMGAIPPPSLSTTPGPSEGGQEEDQAPTPEARQPKWQKPASKGGKGSSQGGWYQGGWGQKRQWEQPAKTGQEPQMVLDQATQDVMRSMVKVVLRHEAEIQRIKTDVGYMVFIDTSGLGILPLLRSMAENWSQKFAQGTVTTPLRHVLFLCMLETLKTKAEEVMQEEERLQRCMNVEWTVQGTTALNPAWVYHTWDSVAKCQIKAETPPLPHSEALRMIDLLIQHSPRDGVLKNFKTPRKMSPKDQYKAEVLPFMASIGLRGESSKICFDALRVLSGLAITKLIGVRIRPERGQESQLIKQLKESYMGTSYCDWGAQDTPWKNSVSTLALACYGTLQVTVVPLCSCDLVAIPVFTADTDLCTRLVPSNHRAMDVALYALPDHMQLVALEESLLLKALRDGVDDASALRPCFTLFTRNEIVYAAMQVLKADSLQHFLEYADMLARSNIMDVLVNVPEPDDEPGPYASRA
ncbi:unnamed protein product, partial [Symbiodinium microadriaticum]